jgi:hypothetical protein
MLGRSFSGSADLRAAARNLRPELLLDVPGSLWKSEWIERTRISPDKTAILLIQELAPQNFTEAGLAIQMVATGEAALMSIHRATIPEQPTETIDRNVARATRLMRLHLEQIEAMQKLKGKAGQQKVTVEHVHVHEGGQAIVGTVNTWKGEGGGGE